MSQFTVNAARIDPYKNFKFRLKWDGRYVAGVSLVGPLRRTTEVIDYREGGSPSLARKLPGVTTFAPIVVERGVSHDLEFERWVNKVWKFSTARRALNLRSRISARTSSSNFSTKQARWRSPTSSAAVGRLASRRCRRSTPMARPSPFSGSCSKTKAGNETFPSPSRRSHPTINLRPMRRSGSAAPVAL